MPTQKNHRPNLGFGLGLREPHYEVILTEHPKVDWFEILAENFMTEGGKSLYYLDKISERYPVVLHGVSLNLGGCDPLSFEYLKLLKKLVKRTSARWISDHLSWCAHQGHYFHDLLPLPYNESVLKHLIPRIAQVQDYLEVPFLIENPTGYVQFKASTMTEPNFLTALAEQTQAYLLLDVNNVYVNAQNHTFDCYDYIKQLPGDKIWQIHLAGHTCKEQVIIDTHGASVTQSVWDLYAYTVQQFGQIATMIERDANIPDLSELIVELEQARSIAQRQVQACA